MIYNNYLYSFVNKEIGKRQTCRHMTITDVKIEYLNYLYGKPREELSNELLELKYRLDYEDDSIDFFTTLIMSMVNFIAVLIGFTIGNVFVSEDEILYLIKIMGIIFVYFIFIISALHLSGYIVKNRKRKKQQFDKFKEECLEEAIQSKTMTRVKVKRHQGQYL